MEMDLPWFLLVFVSDDEGSNKPHILSCHFRSQTYEDKILFSRSHKKIRALKNSRTRLMLLLMENGPFTQVGISYLNKNAVSLAFII